ETSIGHFWSESYGQIYPALRDLSAQGLIRRRPGSRGANRERHVYEITEKGRDALTAWRSEPPRPGPVRNELLLKLFFGSRESASHEVEWIDGLIERERAELREFTAIRERLDREPDLRDHPSLPYWLLTLSYGEHHARSVIRWCRESRRAILAMAGSASRKGTPR